MARASMRIQSTSALIASRSPLEAHPERRLPNTQKTRRPKHEGLWCDLVDHRSPRDDPRGDHRRRRRVGGRVSGGEGGGWSPRRRRRRMRVSEGEGGSRTCIYIGTSRRCIIACGLCCLMDRSIFVLRGINKELLIYTTQFRRRPPQLGGASGTSLTAHLGPHLGPI